MAVDALGVGLNEQPLTVRTHDIAIDALQLHTFGGSYVKEDTLFLACLERIPDDAFSVSTHLGIRLSVGQCLDHSH